MTRLDQTAVDSGIRRIRIRRRKSAEAHRRELAEIEEAGQQALDFTETDHERDDADDLAAVFD